MFKHFIDLEDFNNKKTINNKIVDNFDYFSANLICLFIRQLDLELTKYNLKLEDVVNKYNVNFSLKTKKDTLYKNFKSQGNIKIDIQYNDVEKNIKKQLSPLFEKGLNSINDSLVMYLNLMSAVTNIEYDKKIDLNLYKAYELYNELNSKFNFEKQIQDSEISKYIDNAPECTYHFQKSFATKVHLLILNEYGNDLYINLGSNLMWQLFEKDIKTHPKKNEIEQNDYYKLAKSLRHSLNTENDCGLLAINHYIKHIESNSLFNYKLDAFKSAIEKNVLEAFLPKENNLINKPNRI